MSRAGCRRLEDEPACYELPMKKASEYRRHADECRQLASLMDGEQRDQLLSMATTWEQLAADRERRLSPDDSNCPSGRPEAPDDTTLASE